MHGPASARTDTDETPFVLVRPASPGRFVFASPHSGALYPADAGFDPRLSSTSLRSAEDALIDQLIAPGTDLGASLICARYARAWLDLNRGADELDPRLVEGLAPFPVSPRAAAGYGVAPRLSGDGRPLYADRLSLAEVEGRIAAVHQPWHAALADLMHDARERHGQAVLIDWHSMPARAVRGVGGARGPDVVLGDRHGSSCRPDLTRDLRRAFEALGWRVALNQPYAGGYTTRAWGRPGEGFHSIQIELNRALYFDEAAHAPGLGWARTCKGVARVIAAVLAENR